MVRNYWWQQFKGPQVTFIMDCIRLFFEKCMVNLEYFRILSLDNAQSDQLSTFGILLGFPRPYMVLLDTYPTIFTEDPGEGNPSWVAERYGFADYELETDTPGKIGGVFSSLTADIDKSVVPLPDKWYRPLCKVIANSKNKVGSLGLLDEVVYTLALVDGVTEENIHYTIKPIDTVGEEATKVYGDIIIDIRDTPWSDRLVIQTILNSITESMFAPNISCLVRLELG